MEKLKEELSELQEGALQALLKKGWGGGGNEKGAEGRGKDELREEGDASARQRRARVFADAAAPQSSEQSGCARPLDRYAPGRGRGRGMRRQGPPPGQPRSLGRVVGAAVPSPDPERRPRPLAPSEGAGCGALHHPGRQLRRDAGPALGGRAGYLKRGESFRHSSKSTVIFILPLPPPRLAGGAGGA